MNEPAPRTAAHSRVSMTEVIRQAEANVQHGTAHGGALLYLADTVAGAVGSRHSGGRVVTGGVESFAFRNPVPVGWTVTATGTVVSTGRTSFVVEVILTAEPMLEVTEPTVAAEGRFVMVGVDADGRPVPVPALAG